MYSDYHVHSRFSFDCEENLDNIISRAIQLQMKQIAITDHQDFNWPIANEVPELSVEEYIDTLSQFKEKYKNQIKLLKGVEIGLTPNSALQCENFLSSSDFDFVIGSCHVVDGMDPYYAEFWKGRKDHEAFRLYFATLLESLKCFHKIDTLGHLDYIVRYSPNKDSNYSYFDYTDLIDEVLKFIIDRDIKLEINTSNLAKGFDFPNPHTDIIKRYAELGGGYVTLGSDAHKACDIGYGFEVAAAIVRKNNLKIFEI